MKVSSVLLGRPRAPRKDCTRAATWRRYYERMAGWFGQIAAALDDYPSAQRGAREEEARFLAGVAELDAGIHANQISGEWR